MKNVNTEERLKTLEDFMDQAKLEAAKSAGREEERKAAAERSKERFARCKDIILVACAVVGGVLGVLGFVRSL